MGRLRRLENAFVQVADILVDHGEHFGRIEKRLGGVEKRLEGVEKQLGGIDGRLEGVTERLDRLIAVTIEERTFHYERLRDIERRLAKVEERVGL